MKIVQRPLASLTPYAGNPRTHSEEQIAQIAASIAEFGFTNPILADGKGVIIAGHGRLLAAQRLGLEKVPVITLGHLTEAQRRALVIADNKIAENAGWDEELLRAELRALEDMDFELELTGFSDLELDELLADLDGEDDPETGRAPIVVPEPPRNPVSRTGDLWILGDHRLLCGDSTNDDDVRRLMNGERAVLFATDPPYLVDYDGSNHPTRNKDWSQILRRHLGRQLARARTSTTVSSPRRWPRRSPRTPPGIAGTPPGARRCWRPAGRRPGAFVHQQIIWVKDRGSPDPVALPVET
ncbi:ParB N-terminal domain-containing protein [Jhaorihella thermophila]